MAVDGSQYLRASLSFFARVEELFDAELTSDYYEVQVTLVDSVGLETEVLFFVEVTLGAVKSSHDSSSEEVSSSFDSTKQSQPSKDQDPAQK